MSRRKAYSGWPKGASNLNRIAAYWGREVLADRVWTALRCNAWVFTGATTRRGLCLILAGGHGGHRLIFYTYSDFNQRYAYRNCIPGRDALAWLLITYMFPFKVPPESIAKIREDHHDSMPWLILADRLEDQGEPDHADHLRSAVERTQSLTLPLFPAYLKG